MIFAVYSDTYGEEVIGYAETCEEAVTAIEEKMGEGVTPSEVTFYEGHEIKVTAITTYTQI